MTRGDLFVGTGLSQAPGVCKKMRGEIGESAVKLQALVNMEGSWSRNTGAREQGAVQRELHKTSGIA